VGINLAFTKFLFLCPVETDTMLLARLRTIGSVVGRGFLNDFEAPIARDAQASQSIQFLVRGPGSPPARPGDGATLCDASLAVQVSSRYRPRLLEFEEDVRRRAGSVPILTLDGAVRGPRYSSAEIQQYIAKHASARRPGRVHQNAIVMPLRKSAEWWQKPAIERHTYFYPHMDQTSGGPAAGHVQAASEGLPALYKRMYHNPDGYGRPGQYDFIGYFECEDAAMPLFDRICASLRDPAVNPEWQFVDEGPAWRGRRVEGW
jgi:hypothetical protein